jgi:hypothetical protein
MIGLGHFEVVEHGGGSHLPRIDDRRREYEGRPAAIAAMRWRIGRRNGDPLRVSAPPAVRLEPELHAGRRGVRRLNDRDRGVIAELALDLPPMPHGRHGRLERACLTDRADQAKAFARADIGELRASSDEVNLQRHGH